MKKGFTLKGKKLNLIMLVVGIIMLSIVGTKAATAIGSNMVMYNDTTVKETLDDLVDITLQGNATSADILAGKTAVVKGKLVTGILENTSWPEQYEVIRNKKLVDSTFSSWHYDKLTHSLAYDRWTSEITDDGYQFALQHSSDEDDATDEMVFVASDVILKKSKYTNCILKFGNVTNNVGAIISVYGDNQLLKAITPSSNSSYTIPIGDVSRISFRISNIAVAYSLQYSFYITDYYFE